MQMVSMLDLSAQEHHRYEMVSQIKEEQYAQMTNPTFVFIGNIFKYVKDLIQGRSKGKRGETGLYFRQILR
jgi:hypothetical protein